MSKLPLAVFAVFQRRTKDPVKHWNEFSLGLTHDRRRDFWLLPEDFPICLLRLSHAVELCFARAGWPLAEELTKGYVQRAYTVREDRVGNFERVDLWRAQKQ